MFNIPICGNILSFSDGHFLECDKASMICSIVQMKRMHRQSSQERHIAMAMRWQKPSKVLSVRFLISRIWKLCSHNLTASYTLPIKDGKTLSLIFLYGIPTIKTWLTWTHMDKDELLWFIASAWETRSWLPVVLKIEWNTHSSYWVVQARLRQWI